MNSILKLILISFPLIYGGNSHAQESTPSIIGVLNFPANEKPSVRAGFVKKKNWEVVSPDQIKNFIFRQMWTVSFKGKFHGQIQLEKPSIDNLNEPHKLSVSFLNSLARKYKNRKKLYTDFKGAQAFRPMIINSASYYIDPEEWVSKTIFEFEKKVLTEYTYRLPKYGLCNPSYSKKVGRRAFKLKDVYLIGAFCNKTGLCIAGADIKNFHELDNCTKIKNRHYGNAWFLLKDDEIELLGRNMMAIDSGDYDKDGKSEWLFQIQEPKKNGYKLFYNDLNHFLEIGWKQKK